MRKTLIQEAVKELIGKISDMNTGCPLTPEEWTEVLKKIKQLMGIK